MSKMALHGDYESLLSEVKERVRTAQYAALKSVNKQLVGLYWDIGRIIVERQAGETWGQAIVQQLAGDLRNEFPGVGGFSASNLWRMKGFFETYRDAEKLAPLVREIAWSHNIVIMERCADPLEREFYLRMARKFGVNVDTNYILGMGKASGKVTILLDISKVLTAQETGAANAAENSNTA